MKTMFSIDLGVYCHSANGDDGEHVGVITPWISFSSHEEVADWLEKLASDDPEDPIRSYASLVRREGAKIARCVVKRVADKVAGCQA